VAQKAGRAPDPEIQVAQQAAKKKIGDKPIGRTSDFPAQQQALKEALRVHRQAKQAEKDALTAYRASLGGPGDVRGALLKKLGEARRAADKSQADYKQARRASVQSFDLDSAEAARAAVSEVGAVARKEADRRLAAWQAKNPDAPDAVARVERRRIFREIVEEHRSVTKGGDPPLKFATKDDPKVKGFTPLPKKYHSDVVDSFEVYPDEWQRAFLQEFGDLRIGKVTRGHFSEIDEEIGLSYKSRKVGPNTQKAIDELGFDPYSVEEQLTRVAVHEFGHGMERAVPGLLEMEHAWWLRRAGSSPRLVERDSAFDVEKPINKTQNWYTLKKYTGDAELDRAYEIFTTGVENVLGDGSTRFLDDDLIDFVLGSLLTL
jgi:hypothetical protein